MKIIINNKGIETPEGVLKACNDEFTARILFNRGISTYEEATEIMDISKYKPYNPSEFPQINDAIDIIKESLDKKEKIAVYGDYDVDGVTAVTVLVSALRELGGEIVYHVPDRFTEGYGMNRDIVEELYNQGIKTIITCDCGISNFEEIDMAKEYGMKVVLTDHHTIGEKMPVANVVINPHLLPEGHPAKDISGCATAYYLIKALFNSIGRDDADKYLDLVALSIISDVIPIKKDARYMLKRGLPLILSGNRVGIKAMLEVMGTNILTEEDVSFQIVPRINAAGRMESAKIPVEMLLSNNMDEACELAKKINQFNIDRKTIQKDIFDIAKEQVETEKKNKKILVLYGESWHHGIIGIVAGKICETYGKPCIMLTLSDDGEVIVGSARATEEINIYEILAKHKECLIKFGGHSGAAGLSLEKERLSEFTKKIEGYADIYIAEREEKIYADMQINLNEINTDMLEKIQKLSPYGESFESPQFVSVNVAVKSDRVLPAGHHFVQLEDINLNNINGVIWNDKTDSLEGNCYDFVYSPYKDTYNGRDEIKIKIEKYTASIGQNEKKELELIDRRESTIEEIITEFKDAVIFYEGPEAYKPKLPTRRYSELIENSQIILYSLPKDKKKFNSIVDKTKAKKIICNYSYCYEYDFEKFTKKFLGTIKYYINNSDGKGSAISISEIMGIDKEFVEIFSRLLKSYGYIDFNIKGNDISYAKCNNERNTDRYLEKIVTRYLEEKREYIKASKGRKLDCNI